MISLVILLRVLRGVSVRVTLDAGQDKVLGGEYDKLVAAGAEVVVVGAQGLFNHRFAVVTSGW